MKIKYYILAMAQFIFYTLNIETCLSDQKSDSGQSFEEIFLQGKKLYQEIDPYSVSKKDGDAYTRLIQLRLRTYDHYFAIQQRYSNNYCKITEQLYLAAVINAQQITSTQNPMIFEALQYSLLYASKIIK